MRTRAADARGIARHLLLGLALLQAFAGGALAQQANPDPRASRTVLRPTDAAVAVRTVEFAAADAGRGRLDLYYDAAVAGKRPTLALVSGTEDARGWGGFRDFGRLAAQRGFAAVIPTKRFPRGADGARQGRDDTLALLERIGTLAPDVIDPDRLCVWAFSAGGKTLGAVYAEGAPAVDCVLAFYPVLSLRGFGATDPAWLAAHSPAEMLAASAGGPLPPTLVVRAGRDSSAINDGIDAFTSAALRRNLPLTLINLPEARHAFDWFNDDAWARDAIEASFEFARRATGEAVVPKAPVDGKRRE